MVFECDKCGGLVRAISTVCGSCGQETIPQRRRPVDEPNGELDVKVGKGLAAGIFAVVVLAVVAFNLFVPGRETPRRPAQPSAAATATTVPRPTTAVAAGDERVLRMQVLLLDSGEFSAAQASDVTKVSMGGAALAKIMDDAVRDLNAPTCADLTGLARAAALGLAPAFTESQGLFIVGAAGSVFSPSGPWVTAVERLC